VSLRRVIAHLWWNLGIVWGPWMYSKILFDLVGNGGRLNTIEKDWRRLNPLQVKITIIPSIHLGEGINWRIPKGVKKIKFFWCTDMVPKCQSFRGRVHVILLANRCNGIVFYAMWFCLLTFCLGLLFFHFSFWNEMLSSDLLKSCEVSNTKITKCATRAN